MSQGLRQRLRIQRLGIQRLGIHQIQTWGALGVLVLVGVGYFAVGPIRHPQIHDGRSFGVAEWACPTGYTRQGACLLDALMGGTHSFVLPGLLAAALGVGGGVVLGVALGHDRSPLRVLAQTITALLDALPRLMVVLVVYFLSDHSLLAMGATLGVLSMPTLALMLEQRLLALQATQFIPAARRHGLSEGRLLFFHMLWLSSADLLLAHVLLTGGSMMLLESSLSYAMQVSLSPSEQSWGYLLLDGLPPLYQLATGLGQQGLAYPMPPGLWPLLCVVLSLLAVQWATLVLGQRLTRATGDSR